MLYRDMLCLIRSACYLLHVCLLLISLELLYGPTKFLLAVSIIGKWRSAYCNGVCRSVSRSISLSWHTFGLIGYLKNETVYINHVHLWGSAKLRIRFYQNDDRLGDITKGGISRKLHSERKRLGIQLYNYCHCIS